jgi:hypothetical protein
MHSTGAPADARPDGSDVSLPGRVRAAFRMTVLIGVLVLLAACSRDEESDATPGGEVAPTVATTPDPGVVDGDDEDRTSTSGPTTDADATGPLGFRTERFEVPVPEDAIVVDGLSFSDGEELLQAGIDAGTWSEAEGVRALLSVLLGERSPDLIGGFESLRRGHHGDLVERGVALLESGTLDAAERDDLGRLLAFFVSPTFDRPGPLATFEDAGGGGDDPNGVRRPRQESACGGGTVAVGELVVFLARDTGLCYVEMFNEPGDSVLVPVIDGFVDLSGAVFDQIDRAREGFRELAGSEFGPVRVLLSTLPIPSPNPTTGTGPSTSLPRPEDLALAHVVNSPVGTTCRMAIFTVHPLLVESVTFDLTVAHELFHCVQKEWGGLHPDDFSMEGGADYFAHRLVGECGDLGNFADDLDDRTVNGSLLDTSYEGWFFWEMLDAQGHLTPQAIASVHRGVVTGTPVEVGLAAVVPDLPSVLNEFYVRFMGPGLACGARGYLTSGTRNVTERGPVEFDAGGWIGRRYRVLYAERYRFEQRNDGAGPIGMAEWDDRRGEGAWVRVAPDVRSTCTDEAEWVVIPTALDLASSAPHVIEVTEAEDAGCDPCLLGSWELDLDTMSVWAERLAAQAGQGVSVAMVGTWAIRFEVEGADMQRIFGEQRDIGLQVTIPQGSQTVDLSGSGSGSFSSDGSFFRITDVTDTAQATVGGYTSPWSSTTDSGGAPYECGDNDLSFQLEGVTILADRVPALPEGDPYFGG